MAEISDYLNDLGEQKVQEEKEIEIVENPVVEELCKKFEKWMQMKPSDYDSALKTVKGLKYSSKDVRNFSVSLSRYNIGGWPLRISGLFLSALINNSEEKYFEVIIQHLVQKACDLGKHNTKNVVIIGDTGYFLGAYMQTGLIIVKGSVGIGAGYCMRAGKIKIDGNAGTGLGADSKGGKIYVKGRIEGRGEDCKAEIYQNGKLIW